MNIKQDDSCFRLLKEAEQRLSFIEQSNNIGYWELDVSRKIMFWSPQIYNILGVGADYKCKKRFIRQHLYHEDVIIYKNALYDLLKKYQPINIILRICKDNNTFICRLTASLKYKNSHKFIIGTLHDIDTHIQKQQELLQEKKQTELLNKNKAYFYAQISHDLRQPLQALKIFVSLLREENLSDYQNKLLDKINMSVNNLSFMLDNFLEAGKLDSGGITRKNKLFDLGKLLTDICVEYSDIANQQHIKLKYSGKNVTINNDNVLLERIFRNLLNNAIKYGRGQIYVHWYKIHNIIRVIIKDNGYGFSADILQNIFKAYWQNSSHRGMGSGLGLAIVKELADILDIDIKIKSKEGRGTIFILTLHN